MAAGLTGQIGGHGGVDTTERPEGSTPTRHGEEVGAHQASPPCEWSPAWGDAVLSNGPPAGENGHGTSGSSHAGPGLLSGLDAG